MSENKQNETGKTLAALQHQLPRPECQTCDCFQGFLTQLELDLKSDVLEITAPFKVQADQMHGCLGCNPCPPAAAYARYLKDKQASSRSL